MAENVPDPGLDRALVERFLSRRDEQTFRELYRRHTPALYLFALRLLGGAGRGAEDVVQETWIRAVARLPSFRWEASLRTWLSGITLNLCREALRGQRSQGATAGALMEGAGAHADRGQMAPADRLDLEEAIARLSPGCREVLILHDVEGRTHDEISALLGISEGTSKSQLHKARRSLRAVLGAPGGDASKGVDDDA